MRWLRAAPSGLPCMPYVRDMQCANGNFLLFDSTAPLLLGFSVAIQGSAWVSRGDDIANFGLLCCQHLIPITQSICSLA